jgi:hypothetical protein
MNEGSCEGFEIAIEMRRHRAGEAEASARLDRHLETCAKCRAFESLGAESESRLRADAEAARAAADLEGLRTRGRALALSRWNDAGAFFLFVGFAFLVRIGLRAAGVERGDVSAMDVMLALMLIATPFVEMRRRRRAIEEAWSSDVLFHEMRVDVRQRLLGAGAFVAFGLCSVAFFAADRLLGWGVVPGRVSNVVLSAGLAALSVYVGTVRIPALLRERREIPAVSDPYEGLP